MCPRRISGGPINPFIKLDEITLGVFKQWFEPDFIKQLESLFMCGNLGDPIISKDTLEIYQYLRELNPNIRLAMHTNGSARDTEWWKRLAQLKVKVTFGIDGLADTHHLYRISTDFNKIIENAQAFISTGGVAKWHMLVFAHNEHQIEEARTMSKQMGFVDFSIKHTSRFKQDYLQVIDDAGRPTHRIKPTQTSLDMIPLAEAAQKEVKPHIVCKAQKFKQLYVSACGNVSPCCWLDMEWIPPMQESRIDYMEKILEFPNLHRKTLKEIFDGGFFSKIEAQWGTVGLKECTKQCGSFDKLGVQFVEN
jgi:MoaA/NifB/PqqE/SkfB family radical SAM enzyme